MGKHFIQKYKHFIQYLIIFVESIMAMNTQWSKYFIFGHYYLRPFFKLLPKSQNPKSIKVITMYFNYCNKVLYSLTPQNSWLINMGCTILWICISNTGHLSFCFICVMNYTKTCHNLLYETYQNQNNWGHPVKYETWHNMTLITALRYKKHKDKISATKE